MTGLVGMDAQRGWRMILRRFAALFAGEGAARIIGFAITLLLARRLGPTGFGIVTLGLTLVAWFTFIVDSGTEILNVREIARQPHRFKHIAEYVLGLRLVLAAVATVAFVAAVGLFARSDFTRSTLLLFAFVLPAAALNLRWMVLGVGGSRAIAAGVVMSRLVVLIGVLLLVSGLSDVKAVPLIEGLAELVYALVILVIVGGGLTALRPRANWVEWARTLKLSLPLMANGLARSVAISFDILLIDIALGPSNVGIYAVASKPAFFVAGLVGLFSMSFLSAFSATEAEAAAALKRRALRWALASGVAVAAVVCASALLIPLLFGAEYRRAIPVLAIIAWRLPFGVLAGVYGSVLIARDRQVDVMRNSMAVAGFVVCADLVAVLAFGLIGAAVVTVVAGALAFVLNRRSVRRAAPDLVGDRLLARKATAP